MFLVVRRYKKCSSPAEREGSRYLFAVSWSCSVALAAWCNARAPASPPVTAMEAESDAIWLRKSCEAGSAADCHALGVMYTFGQDLPRDEARSAELYRKGCDGGEAGGCFYLGVAYAEGRGVPRDDTRAKELFRNLCDKGDEAACLTLLHSYSEWPGAWPR